MVVEANYVKEKFCLRLENQNHLQFQFLEFHWVKVY